MAVAQFAREYTTVRRAEGWGSRDRAYYRALPYRDLSGRYAGIWRIRARSYATFVERVLEPLEHDSSRGHVAAYSRRLATEDTPRGDPYGRRDHRSGGAQLSRPVME